MLQKNTTWKQLSPLQAETIFNMIPAAIVEAGLRGEVSDEFMQGIVGDVSIDFEAHRAAQNPDPLKRKPKPLNLRGANQRRAMWINHEQIASAAMKASAAAKVKAEDVRVRKEKRAENKRTKLLQTELSAALSVPDSAKAIKRKRNAIVAPDVFPMAVDVVAVADPVVVIAPALPAKPKRVRRAPAAAVPPRVTSSGREVLFPKFRMD